MALLPFGTALEDLDEAEGDASATAGANRGAPLLSRATGALELDGSGGTSGAAATRVATRGAPLLVGPNAVLGSEDGAASGAASSPSSERLTGLDVLDTEGGAPSRPAAGGLLGVGEALLETEGDDATGGDADVITIDDSDDDTDVEADLRLFGMDGQGIEADASAPSGGGGGAVGKGLISESETVEGLAEDDGALGTWLISKWCHGKMGAKETREGAIAGVKSGARTSDTLLKRLASLSEHNAHRDLQRCLSKGRKLPPLYWALIPIWCAITMTSRPMWHPFLLPHEWLHHLAEGHLDEWQKFPDVMGQRLEDWKRRASACEKGPPFTAISFWGDTAPFHTGQDSVLLLQWRCLAPEQIRRVWTTVINKNALCDCGCKGRHTIDAMWDVIGWSLNSLARGTFPHRDHLGAMLTHKWRSALAGKDLAMRAACLSFRGDWPWLSWVFGFPSHSANYFCFFVRLHLQRRQLDDAD